MIAAVIDASIVATWILSPEEPSSRSLRTRANLLTLDLLYPEVGNALWAGVHAKRYSSDVALRGIDDLMQFPLEVLASKAFLPHALELSIALDHPVYDCSYLALALANNCRLYTADKQFVRRVQRSPWKELIAFA